MESSVIVLTFIVLLSFSEYFTQAANILSIIPFPMKSHDSIYKPLLFELARKGHNITEITQYKMASLPNVNYQQIVVETRHKYLYETIDFYKFRQETKIWTIGLQDLKPFWDTNHEMLEDIFRSTKVEAMINSIDANFDLIICEAFFAFESLLAFGHRFNAPVIAVSSLGSTIYMNPYIGNPILSNSDPHFELPYTHDMSLVERFHNSLVNMLIILAKNIYQMPNQQKLVDKYFAKSFKLHSREPITVNELAKEVDLVFINRHPVLGFPRPHLPNVIDISGLHLHGVESSSDTDEELMKIMDDANLGFVYFSFGSGVKTAQMSVEHKTAFMKVFSRLPLSVLVKWDEPNPPDCPKNVYIRKWFPQQKVLGHRNCRAFITHGGMLSIEETIYHGVPIIGVPFFGDQPMNIIRAEQLRFGIRLEYDNVTDTSLSWALNEIIHNNEYKNTANKISAQFRDSPQSPLERAVYWVEYVLRHKGADHLKCQARNLSWIEHMSIDVAALLFIILYIVYKSIIGILPRSSSHMRKFKPKRQ